MAAPDPVHRFLRSVPPDAGEDVAAALTLLLSSQRKGSWVRTIFVAACALVGSGWVANGYLHQLVTKEDITKLEASYSAARSDQFAHDQKQDDRISATEQTAVVAEKCCTHQTQRIDQLTKPR